MDKYWYCGVLVKGIQAIYSYISDMGEIQLDSYVMVPFGSQNTPRIGIVKSCAEYAAEEAPYPVEWTKHIIREATAEEYENQTLIAQFYTDNDIEDDIENELDEVNFYIETEDWEAILGWACDHHDCLNGKIARKVIECYELCQKQEMPIASVNLGTFYYTGRFVEQDYQRAYELYKLAADAGNLRAICNCGYCFYYGRHQDIDYEKAYEYFTLGALLHNDANCLYKLGDMYLNGYGVTKNENYAFTLYQRALHRSFENDADSVCIADAQFRVGKCLLYGIGADKNIEEAHELLSFALVNFYKRRKTDIFVVKLIKSTKELLTEAQACLDKEISDYQG